MANSQDHVERGPPNYPYAMPLRRRSLPRRTTETRHYEPIPKHPPGFSNRVYRRPSGAKYPVLATEAGDPDTLASTLGEATSDLQPGTSMIPEPSDRSNITTKTEALARLVTPSIVPTSLASVAASSRRSNSSSETGSTVTESPFIDTDTTVKPSARRQRVSTPQPNALHFLDSDSPTITPESILRSMEEASRRSPTSLQGHSPSTRSISTISSGFRDDASEPIGDHETDRSTSPERGIDGDGDGKSRVSVSARPGPGPRTKAAQHRARSYEMSDVPRNGSQHSQSPPGNFTPRTPNQGRMQNLNLPRPERVPVTGYQLLASKLSAMPDRADRFIRPMYRRFETLNHRLLLYLQDEICELEEQLRQLDAADTQNRRLPNCIFPESRRAESMAGGELHWRRTDVLGKIGFRLEQYNRLLSSCKDTQVMPSPTLEDIHEYRTYLATHAPIAEVETHFLDVTDDLVCLNDDGQEEAIEEDIDEEPLHTPMSHPDFTMVDPGSRSPIRSRPVSPYRLEEIGTETVDDNMNDEPAIIPLSIAVTVAVILPILTFLVIPGYLGRLTVVFLVGLGILGALIQGQIVSIRTRELLVCVGLYGAVMAVIAGVVT
ncbi:hypothetical protein GGR52DRAFT_568408 [Hypoxylon sp. FL1284]|nr:hypothetical protein GGR52DRAFT_568408 [Hypoxylon sp. FL1284]